MIHFCTNQSQFGQCPNGERDIFNGASLQQACGIFNCKTQVFLFICHHFQLNFTPEKNARKNSRGNIENCVKTAVSIKKVQTYFNVLAGPRHSRVICYVISDQYAVSAISQHGPYSFNENKAKRRYPQYQISSKIPRTPASEICIKFHICV